MSGQRGAMLRFHLWRTAHPRELFREIEVRSSVARDQPSAQAECQILDRLFDKNQNPILKCDEIHQVNESPEQPCK
jgi:hypothetical protein